MRRAGCLICSVKLGAPEMQIKSYVWLAGLSSRTDEEIACLKIGELQTQQEDRVVGIDGDEHSVLLLAQMASKKLADISDNWPDTRIAAICLALTSCY